MQKSLWKRKTHFQENFKNINAQKICEYSHRKHHYYSHLVFLCMFPLITFIYSILPSLFCPSPSGWTCSGLLRQQERSRIHRGAGRSTLRSRKTKAKSILWVRQLGQGCRCFVEEALVWHLTRTALGVWSGSMWPCLTSYFPIFTFLSAFKRLNLPQSSSVSKLL